MQDRLWKGGRIVVGAAVDADNWWESLETNDWKFHSNSEWMAVRVAHR